MSARLAPAQRATAAAAGEREEGQAGVTEAAVVAVAVVDARTAITSCWFRFAHTSDSTYRTGDYRHNG